MGAPANFDRKIELYTLAQTSPEIPHRSEHGDGGEMASFLREIDLPYSANP
jgi:hypothetical protein